MTNDSSLVLLFAPLCNIVFVGGRSRYGFRKSFIFSFMAPRKMMASTEFHVTFENLIFRV